MKSISTGSFFLRFFAPAFALAFSGFALAADQAGTIVNVTGNVLVRDVTGKGMAAKAKPGDKIKEGCVINTASDASVKILMSDKTIVDLGPSSLFKVDEYKVVNGADDRKATLDLQYGRIRTLVKKSIGPSGNFRIRTKSATMGVRGTEFVVMSDLPGFEPPKSQAPAGAPAPSTAPQMKVVVLEGKVEVTGKAMENTAEKKVALTEGMQLKAEVVQDEPAEKTEEGSAEETKREPAQAPPVPVVETISKEEQKEVAKETRVADTTFKQSVEIDRSVAGGGSSGQSTWDTLKDLPELTAPPEIPQMTADSFSASEFHGLVGQTVKLTIKFNGSGGGL